MKLNQAKLKQKSVVDVRTTSFHPTALKSCVHTANLSPTEGGGDQQNGRGAKSSDVTESILEKTTVKFTTNNLSQLQKEYEHEGFVRLRGGLGKGLFCAKCSKIVKSILFPKREISLEFKKSVPAVPKKEVIKKYIWELLKESNHEKRCDGYLRTVGWDDRVKNYISQCDKCDEKLFIFFIDKPNGNTN